jgi:hypothetical protein
MKYFWSKFLEAFIILSIVAITAGMVYYFWNMSKSCSDSGGVLVRGIMWFECVRK